MVMFSGISELKASFGRASFGRLSLAAFACISTVCFGQASNQTQLANKDAPTFPIECARADLDLFTEIEAKGIEGANSTVLVFAQDLLQSARKQCTDAEKSQALQIYEASLRLLSQGPTLAQHTK